MAGKGNKSIYEDRQLRKKVALAVCHKINELMLKENPGMDRKNLYTDDEIISWVNQSGFNYFFAQSPDRLDKIHEMFEDLPYDKEFETPEKGCRFAYLFLNSNDDEASKAHNLRVKNYSMNSTMRKIFACKVLSQAENHSMEKFFPTSIEELDHMSENDYWLQAVGNEISIAAEYFSGENSKLVHRLHNNAGFCESDPQRFYRVCCKSPFYLLIPPNHDLTYIPYKGSTIQAEINKVISDISPDISEIKNLSPDYVPGDPTDFTTFHMESNNLKIVLNDNKTLKEMQKKEYITSGSLTNYYYLKDGKEITAMEAIQHFRDGKLRDGVSLQITGAKDEKEFAEARRRIEFDAKKCEMEIIADTLRKRERSNSEETLLKNIDHLLKEYELNKNEKVKLSLKEFKEVHYRTLDEIEEGINKIYVNKVRAIEAKAEKDVIFYKNHMSEAKNLSYAELATRAEETSRGSRKEGKLTLDHNKILENLSLIWSIKQKDDQYKSRNFIARLWFRNSHQKMMDKRNELIENLCELVDKSKADLEKLGSDPDNYKELTKITERVNKANNIKIEKDAAEKAAAEKAQAEREAAEKAAAEKAQAEKEAAEMMADEMKIQPEQKDPEKKELSQKELENKLKGSLDKAKPNAKKDSKEKSAPEVSKDKDVIE